MTTPIAWRVQGITGLALFGMACAAARVDILQNIKYGVNISTEAAIVLGLAAGCVVILPTAASALRWRDHLAATVILWATTTLCVALTVFCAHKAYSTKQDGLLLTAKAGQETYDTAAGDAAKARETLKRITELGDAEALATLLKQATNDRAIVCDGKHKHALCEDAQTKESVVIERLSNAKARDKAEATIKAAEAKKQSGPTRFAGDDIDAERSELWLMNWAMIAATQLIAMLGGHGASLFGGAWTARKAEMAATKPRPRRAESTPEPRPQGGPDGGQRSQRPTPRPTPTTQNVTVLHQPTKAAVKTWFESATVPAADGRLRGYEALQVYQRKFGKDSITHDELRRLMQEIYPQQYYEAAGGYSIRGIAIRLARHQAEQQKIILAQ